MNTNRDVVSGSNLGMSSGSEVESAAWHTGSTAIHSPDREVTVIMPGRSLRSKLDDVKTMASSRIHDVKAKAAELQRSLAVRSSEAKHSLHNSMTTAKSTARVRANESIAKIQTSMQTSPMKWAGIAAGSGLAIGLLGRLLDARRHHHRHMPQLVVIETSC